MKITAAQVTSYQSVTDSGEFSLEPDVTCLVGKNESGKTAVLEAIYRLRPLPTGHPEDFEELRDYPRRYRSQDQGKIPDTDVIALTVELDEADVGAIEAKFGGAVIAGRTATVVKDYSNRIGWDLDIDGGALMRSVLERAGVDAARADGATTQGELTEKLRAWGAAPEEVATLISELETRHVEEELMDALGERLPG